MVGSGMMKSMMLLQARDLTGPALSSAASRTKRLAEATKSEFRDMASSVVSYRKLVGSILTAKLMSRGFAYVEMGIANVTRNIVEMDQALTAASAKFGEVSRRGTAGFDLMEEKVRMIGATTEYTSAEAAKGLDFLAMAGFGYEQSLAALVPLTDLATAAQLDLARASDIASDALGAFGLSTAPDDIARSLGRVNDVFAETVTSSNTTMETLFDTMKHSGPAVVAAGGNIEMFAALTGKLGSAGIKGTIAGTTLKNMFTRLVAPPSEARKALRKLHIEIDRGDGKMKDMITILGELNKAMSGKTEIAREKFIKDIFGMRAISGVNVLLNEGEQSLRDYYTQIENSEGAAKRMADTMRMGLGVQLKVLQSTLTEKGFQIFQGLMGETDPAEAVKKLSEVIRDFDTGTIVEVLTTIGRIAKDTAVFLYENRELLLSIGKVWIATEIASKVGGAVQAVSRLTGAFIGGAGVSQAASLTGAAVTATTSVTALTGASSALKMGLMNAQPVLMAFVGGLQLGHELMKAVGREQRRRQEEENQAVIETVHSRDFSYAEAKKRLEARKSKWGASALERMTTGEKGLDLLTGELSRNKTWRMQQESARSLVRQMDRLAAQESEATSLRNAWFGGRGPQFESSADYWRGEGFGPSSAWMAEQQGMNVSGQSGPLPQIIWDPKQEIGVTVVIQGAPEGTTATATVTPAPPVDKKRLGVPNG